MKQFKKYCHIENSYQVEFLGKIKEVVPATENWVCQEKIHGTNSSFVVGRGEDGQVEIDFAKKSGILADNENFYNWQLLIEEKKNAVIALFELLEKDYDCSAGVSIFGEFFGGGYEGQPVVKGIQKIQKGIQYCPGHEFYGFDIYVQGYGYLPPEKSSDYFKQAGLFYAETLFKGTLEDCLKYPNTFPSTIPHRLGLPEIEENMCEGVVIKPCTPQYFNNGERILIKNKNPKFQEIIKGDKKPKVEKQYSEAYNNLAAIIPDYINENRLASCRSHLGETTLPKDFGKILGEYSKDVILEALEETEANKAVYETLEKEEQKALRNLINKLCAENIKHVYMGA